MLVRKPTTHIVEIGPLDAALLLPLAGRKKLGMKTTCHKCGKPIEDKYFVGGFKKGHRNMLFHESCIDDHTRKLIQ